MLTCKYTVERIDGDYAMLRRLDEEDPQAEPKMVARALLPPEIAEGTTLLYEYLQYSIIEWRHSRTYASGSFCTFNLIVRRFFPKV